MSEWEQVGGATQYIKPSQLKEGDTIEGVFCGTEKDPKFGTLKHSLRQEDGSLKIVNGSGQLNFVMESIAKGEKIRIVFEGKKKLESGKFMGTMANQWKVLRAKGNSSTPVEVNPDADVPF